MGLFSSAKLFGMTIRESATDGSDFTNPDADYRRLFLGEDGALHLKDSAGAVTDIGGAGGAVATDAIWDAAGDLAVGSGANTAARLAVGANGTRPEAASGESTGIKWSLPPGYEFDYAEVTSGNVSITATTEATANTVVTGGAVTYDGSTAIILEFFCPFAAPPAGNINIIFALYDGSSSIGKWGQLTGPDATNTLRVPTRLVRRLTPSAASHTYSVRAYVDSGTGTVNNGAGGSGNYMPLYLRQTKA